MAFLTLVVADEPAQRFALGPVAAGNGDGYLRDAVGRGRGARHFHAHGVVQELVGQALDFRRHGGGIKQRLPRERDQLADALDVRDETHVEHAVGFVDHQNLHLVQHQLAALEMIEQAARRRDQHVHAAVELLVLVVERHAADQAAPWKACDICRSARNFRRPAPPVRAWAPESACAACAPWRGPRDRISIIGSVNDAVLPVPVCAMPMMSRPFSTCGNALRLDGRGRGVAGIGNGFQDIGA